MTPVQESMRILNYVSLSAITLMVYDWVLSFGDEFKYIWSAAWSAPKVLYVISRYYPVCYLSCSDYTWYHGFGGVICILPPVTAIFTLRICAIYRHSRMVIIFVWFLWFGELPSPSGELITTFRVTIGEHTDKTTTYGPGCLTETKADPTLYRSELLAWAPALTGSLTLFILTLYRLGYIFPQFLKRKHLSFGDHNRLMIDFLTDGTIYFFFIFVATLLTMISDLLPKLTFFNDWWNPWFILLYSLSGSRLVINLRRNGSVGSEIASMTAPEAQLSSMEFWTPTLRSVAFNPDDYLEGELSMEFAPGKDVCDL
ncbi:hypothetical protein HYPSUDRAFT_69897 [Hypholoma sublateritium FD-334 SS-4]|uniref:DUF6533 domain-containing protein n=1 Tax=Hypholoma sublateritium (strain FD-334 SS-4) TaxID=945553 RepID=A0A0D2KV18_HYPSF|nr:hypothetical protein HYPSUDRAFT_69897 [Hypholoma sublateritium FD-334 SS-4]